MALIQCDECGKEISDKAVSCPSCGVPRTVATLNVTEPKTPTKSLADSGSVFRKAEERKASQRGQRQFPALPIEPPVNEYQKTIPGAPQLKEIPGDFRLGSIGPTSGSSTNSPGAEEPGKVLEWLLILGGAAYVAFVLSAAIIAIAYDPQTRRAVEYLWEDLAIFQIVEEMFKLTWPGMIFVIFGRPISRAIIHVKRKTDKAAKIAIAAKSSLAGAPVNPTNEAVPKTGNIVSAWMRTNTLSKAMLAFGLLLMWFAWQMDPTVSTGYGRVYNLHLGGQQTIALFVGGLFFLAGVILSAAVLSKQLPADQANREADLATIRQQGQETIQRAIVATLSGLSSAWLLISTHFSRSDGVGGRILTGLFVGLSLPIVFEALDLYTFLSYFPSYGAWLVLGATWVAFRPLPASQAIRQLLGANAFVFAGLGIWLAVSLLWSSITDARVRIIDRDNLIFLIWTSPVVPSAFLYFFIGIRARRHKSIYVMLFSVLTAFGVLMVGFLCWSRLFG